MSWALKRVRRYDIRSGNNLVPLAYWTHWAMQLTLQSPKNRPCFDAYQFCPYCQTFAVCLFTEFSDLSFFSSIPPCPQFAPVLRLHSLHQPPFKLRPLFCSIYFHIFQPVTLFLGISLGTSTTDFQGCLFTKFEVSLLTSSVRRRSKLYPTFSFNPFLIAILIHHFLLTPSVTQKMSFSRCFFYFLALNLCTVLILSAKLILFLMVNFQLVRYLWSWMLGKTGRILWCEVHKAVEFFIVSVSLRVTLLSKPVLSVSELVTPNCLHSYHQHFKGGISLIHCRCF